MTKAKKEFMQRWTASKLKKNKIWKKSLKEFLAMCSEEFFTKNKKDIDAIFIKFGKTRKEKKENCIVITTFADEEKIKKEIKECLLHGTRANKRNTQN